MTAFIPPKLPAGRPVSITRRQADVLELACLGLSNLEIGKRLYITEDTVKQHMRAVLLQLGATSRVHAAALVYSGLTVELRPGNRTS